MTHRVLFLPHRKEVQVAPGETLIRAAMEAKVHVNASCGGEGVCGKCRVVIEAGSVDGGLSEKLSAEDIQKGVRLACRAKVTEDVTVRIPVESEVDAKVLNRGTRKTARIRQMNFQELKERGLFLPPVEKKYLQLPLPSAGDNQADVTRLVNFLRMAHGEHRLEVDLSVIRKIGAVFREGEFAVTVTLARPVREMGKTRIIHIQPGDTSLRNYAIAVDIGTTTVFGQLIDLVSGEALAEHGEFNGQISYGEDVISRMVLAEKGDGLEVLNRAVVATINTVIGQIVGAAGVDPDEISAVTLAGNTTMTQLFLKVDTQKYSQGPLRPGRQFLSAPSGVLPGSCPGKSCDRPGLPPGVELCGGGYRGGRYGVGDVPFGGTHPVHGHRHQRRNRGGKQGLAGLRRLFGRSRIRRGRHHPRHAGGQGGH